jgi:oxygen-dependent protoporphyrinogen oxidase
VIYEAGARVGGLLRTEEIAPGVRVDAAVQLVSSTYTRLFALAREAGVADMLVRASGNDALWRRGSAQEITYGSVSSMATSGALPTMLKLKLGAKYVPYLTMQTGTLDANDPARTGGERQDSESIASWGRREMSDDFVEYLAYPLLAAYYGSVPERTSAAMYHALARVGMDVRVFAVRGGMAALAQGIVSALQSRGVRVMLGTRVTAVRKSAGWRVESDQTAEEYDAVIVATPPHVAAAIVNDAPAVTEWLRDATTNPAVTVGVALNGTMRAPYFGLSFPRRASPGDRIVAVTLQHNKPASLVPSGSSALTVFPAPSEAARVASMNDDEARGFLTPALEQAYPGISRRITAYEVFRDMEYRSLDPGMMRRIRELDSIDTPDGLAIAGDYTTAPTVEGAVRSGERAAQRCLGS